MQKNTHIDPSLLTIVSSSFETLVNTALRHNPASQQRIDTLHGILAVELTYPKMMIYLQGHENNISVTAYCESDITTTITGSPLALLGLLQQPNNLKNSGVSISGDTHLLSQWQTLIQQLDIDWEDAISHYLGDILGPMVSSSLHKSTQWTKQQWSDKQRLVSEYLIEELNVIPSQSELENFYQQVDQLALETDRVAAKTKALINTLKTNTSVINKD